MASQKRKRNKLRPTPDAPSVDGLSADEYCRLLRGNGQSSIDALRDVVVPALFADETAAAAAVATTTVMDDTTEPNASGRLLLTLIDAQYRHAYDLQLAALSPGGRVVGESGDGDGGGDDRPPWPLEDPSPPALRATLPAASGRG